MSIWTEERIAMLRQLHAEGLSFAEIGRRIDVSKNAVIGKSHRLGLPKRPHAIKRPEHYRKKATKETAPVTTFGTGPKGNNYTRCCWSFGHPKDPDFKFCGEPCLKAKPYCSEHYAKAYIQPNRQADKA